MKFKVSMLITPTLSKLLKICNFTTTNDLLEMKKMTCKQLGGACDLIFEASTFEEIAELSKKHGMEMFQKQDSAHMEAMQEMQKMMQNPDAMQKWMDEKRREFEAL